MIELRIFPSSPGFISRPASRPEAFAEPLSSIQGQSCKMSILLHGGNTYITLFLDQNCLLLTPLATLYIELIICEICDILQLCLRLLLTAKHCIAKYFYEWCVEESDCYAYFRDLVAGPANHERGQFTVPLIEMYEKEGRSDLAIVKLAFEV